MTNNKREQGISSILVMSVVVVVIGVVYIVGTQGSRLATTTPLVVPATISDTERAVDINTSGWATHTNKTYGFSIEYPSTYQIQSGNEEQNTCIWLNSNSPCEVLINVYDNKGDLTLTDYLNKNLSSFAITGPLVSYDFNGYDSLLNKNQPGTYLFIKRGLWVYRFVAPKASENRVIEAMVNTFKFVQ